MVEYIEAAAGIIGAVIAYIALRNPGRAALEHWTTVRVEDAPSGPLCVTTLVIRNRSRSAASRLFVEVTPATCDCATTLHSVGTRTVNGSAVVSLELLGARDEAEIRFSTPVTSPTMAVPVVKKVWSEAGASRFDKPKSSDLIPATDAVKLMTRPSRPKRKQRSGQSSETV